jgi:transposase
VRTVKFQIYEWQRVTGSGAFTSYINKTVFISYMRVVEERKKREKEKERKRREGKKERKKEKREEERERERKRRERKKIEEKTGTYECGILLDIIIKDKFYLSK